MPEISDTWLPSGLALDLAHAARLIDGAVSTATRRKYAAAWDDFCRYAQTHGAQQTLPASPAIVAAFLAGEDQRGLAPATIQVKASAIAYYHQQAGHISPTDHPQLKSLMQGQRVLAAGHGKRSRKAPLIAQSSIRQSPDAQRGQDDLLGIEAVVDAISVTTDTGQADLRGLRDRAMLLLGFAGAFRRSELVSLDHSMLQETPEGLLITLPRSKGDQQGLGQRVGIARSGSRYCPVAALRAWLAAAGLNAGPLFRRIRSGGKIGSDGLTDHGYVQQVVKPRVAAVGLDPAHFAGHSLRRGAATSAARAGADVLKIQRKLRHKQITTSQTYVEEVEIFQENATKTLL